MARLTKFDKQRLALPPPGTALRMSLEDGRFGVCRVIRLSTEAERAYQGAVLALVALSPWIGDEVPPISDMRLREVQILTHHSFKNEACVLWVGGAIPEGFLEIGLIEPTFDELALTSASSSTWGWFPLQLVAQWRWDHEREAVVHQDDAEQEQKRAANRNAAEEYGRYLDSLTLEGLQQKVCFENWKGFVPTQGLRSCQNEYRGAIQAILHLGPNPGVKAVVRIIRASVQRINEIDDQNHNFIETIAREELAEAYDELAYVAGLRTESGLALRWADW